MGDVDIDHASSADAGYSTAAKWFHWLTVPPLVIVLLSGATIRFIADETKPSFYTWHESLGLLMLGLSVARLAWRWRHPPPPLPMDIPPLMRRGAGAVHAALYVGLVSQPVLGFFTTNAYGFPQQGPTAFLGVIDLPRFMEASQSLAVRLHVAHSVLGWLIGLLLVAHVGGVVYHDAVRGERVLLRMV